MRAAEDRLRKERSGVTVPTFCVIPHRSLSSGHFSLGQAQELVQGFQTPCFLGSSGINVQQLPFLALVSPQVRLLEATELTWPGCPASAVTVTASSIKWLEGRSVRLWRVTPRTQLCLCLPGGPLAQDCFLLKYWCPFYHFLVPRGVCLHYFLSSSVICQTFFFFCLSNPTNLCSERGVAAQSFTSLSFNWIAPRNPLQIYAVSEKKVSLWNIAS